EYAVAAVQHQDFAGQQLIPVACSHTFRQDIVEDEAAGAGQQQAEKTPVMDAQAPRESRLRLLDVGSAAAEALLAEVVRQAVGLDGLETWQEIIHGTTQLAQHQTETISFQRPGLELAAMPRRLEHLDAAGRERRPVRLGFAIQVQGEVLDRHRMPLLEAGIAHLASRDAGVARQLLRYPMGVGFALLYQQHHMGTFPVCLETQHLFHPEVFRHRTDAGSESHGTIGPGPIGQLIHQISSRSATACAAMPSPRPIWPRPSLVVAFTLTCSRGMPRPLEMTTRMAIT